MRRKGGPGEMMRQLMASAAAVALFVGGGASSAFAQEAGGTSSGQTPGQTQNPAQKLPEVEVIQGQQQPKPKPVKKASKPKAKPAAAAAVTAPSAAPVEGTEATTEGMQYAEPPESSTVKMSPVGGTIPVDKMPGSVYQMNSAALKRGDQVILQDALVSQIPGLIVNDIQGNQFQTNIQFRGFEASPVNGVAQGLAVYQNGVRINESFGDIVNWDFLP